MKNEVINELNTFLKGEHMAVNGYEKYIQKTDDKEIKQSLQKIQQDHKQHAVKIAERIQNIGGQPANEVGVVGKMAGLMSKLKNINKKDTLSILKLAHDGEKNGINMAKEIVKGDLDQKSSNLINNIINDDQQHLSTLKNLMNKSKVYSQ